MVKYLRISSYIRKPFLIYDFATDPFWISLYMNDEVGWNNAMNIDSLPNVVNLKHDVLYSRFSSDRDADSRRQVQPRGVKGPHVQGLAGVRAGAGSSRAPQLCLPLKHIVYANKNATPRQNCAIFKIRITQLLNVGFASFFLSRVHIA